MIRKIVHYIWLGNGPKSKLINICINSWYEKLPDYKIIEWNESNLDLDQIAQNNRFFRECRKRKLWAFMADYLRLKILYENGGIYFDTDVQVLKNLNTLLENEFFLGYEYDYAHNIQIGTGVIACEKGNKFIKKCLQFYENDIWNTDIYTIPSIMTRLLTSEASCKIYPCEYFAPFSYLDAYSRSSITENTYAIHWFEGSWGKLAVRTFLKTKHIKNPLKGIFYQILRTIQYYFEKIEKLFK